MLSNEILTWLDMRARQIFENPTLVWGGLAVRLSGDVHQLPPVGATCLIRPSTPASSVLLTANQTRAASGANLWSAITSVISLDVSHRCAGAFYRLCYKTSPRTRVFPINPGPRCAIPGVGVERSTPSASAVSSFFVLCRSPSPLHSRAPDSPTRAARSSRFTTKASPFQRCRPPCFYLQTSSLQRISGHGSFGGPFPQHRLQSTRYPLPLSWSSTMSRDKAFRSVGCRAWLRCYLGNYHLCR